MGKAFLYGVGGGSGGGGTLQDKTTALDMSQGDQEIVADAGYDGLSKAKVTRPATLIPENIKNGVSVGGVTGNYVGSAIQNDLDGLVDNTITTFTMPQGKTKIRSYLFQGNTSLTSANLQGATQIEDRAFYQCSNAEITLPSTLTNVGQYAFSGAGKSSSPMILNCPNSACNVGQSAFQGAKISKIKGKLGTVGNSAFYVQNALLTEIDLTECGSVSDNGFSAGSLTTSGYTGLTKLHIRNFNGSLGSGVFFGHSYVNDFVFEGVITSMYGSTFVGLGNKRSNPEQSIITIDLSRSTFTSTGNSSFCSADQYGNLKYTNIILPSTLKTVGSYSFYKLEHGNVFFTSQTPPTVQSNTFTNISNTTIWVPYNSVNAYRTAPNWSASTVVSAIKGYAPANTFTTGQTLPTINEEGYGITWYSDKACTVQVTTADDPTQELYCIVGTTILAYRIQSVNTMDCTVAFSDGTNTYVQGDQVPVGTSLTIASVATDPTKTQVYMFDINGTDYKPATSETITVASDITVICLYYDGVNPPVNPVLNNNTWQQILIGCQNGLAGTLWQVGDTKTDSTGLVWAIVDMKDSRYQRANGTGYTKCAFMPIGRCFDQTTTWRTSYNSENYSQSLVNTKLSTGGVFYNQIDPTLAALVDANKIIVKASQYNSSTTVDCTVGFFALSYTEWGFTGSYNYATSAETVCNGVTMGAFEYFADNQNSKRIFRDSNGTAQNCWSRSRYISNYAVFVNTSGSNNRDIVSSFCRVCPCFAW